MKKIFTILLTMLSTITFAQSWQNMGNVLQRQIVGSDTIYRVNLGTPGYMYLYTKPQLDTKLGLKLNISDTTAMLSKVVHKSGIETITGHKTFSTLVTFANGSVWDVAGPAAQLFRRASNSTPMAVLGANGTLINTSIILGYSGDNSGTSIMSSSAMVSLVSMKDTLNLTSGVINYSSIKANGRITQSGSSTGKTSAFFDNVDIISATDFAGFRSNRNTGYAFKFEGTAPGLTNGDVEIGSNSKGLILKSPDGTRYRITVANGGTLTVTAL